MTDLSNKHTNSGDTDNEKRLNQRLTELKIDSFKLECTREWLSRKGGSDEYSEEIEKLDNKIARVTLKVSRTRRKLAMCRSASDPAQEEAKRFLNNWYIKEIQGMADPLKPPRPTKMLRIGNHPFDLTYMVFDEANYGNTLKQKHDQMRSRFEDLFTSAGIDANTVPNVDIISSPAMHSRQKCRFAIGYDGVGKAATVDESQSLPLVHLMWESGHPTVIVDAFPIASQQIYNAMPVLLSIIQSDTKFKALRDGFAAVHYLSTQAEHLLITMIYELPDEAATFAEAWHDAAQLLHTELVAQCIPSVRYISIIGRCKGVKITIGDDFVFESLTLKDGRILRYKQVEEGFSNPNSVVNQRALDWLCGIAQEITGIGKITPVSATHESNAEQFDLLEMYCGNGNHTVALAPYFSRAMGVEINPALCAAATENFQLNCITNAHVVVADSAKFATQILRTKQYRLYPKVEKTPTPVHAYKPPAVRTPAVYSVMEEDSVAPDVATVSSPVPTVAQADADADTDTSDTNITFSDSNATSEETATGTAGEEPKKVKVLTEAQKARAIRKAAAVAAQRANKPAKAEPLYVFKFGTVLVDPPRCGLDTLTLSLVANYEHILYISCCPDSLMRDLTQLLKTHTLRRVAIFDQFAYTPHIETGVWLSAKK